jgi:Protein of unknown function (DUF3644)
MTQARADLCGEEWSAGRRYAWPPAVDNALRSNYVDVILGPLNAALRGQQMAPRPRWWHTMQEARRQACVAVDFYNRAGDKRSFHDFVMHMHLAWQDLLHADLQRRKVDIFYRADNGRYARGKDGEKRTWELQRCLKHEYENNDPTRLNGASDLSGV